MNELPTGRKERAAALELLAGEAAACTRCRLAEGRTQVVFGYGDPDARVMVIGEGPGKREDEQGLPFVGPSGKLLDNLLEEIGLRRGDGVYIANVVKCRPPNNRDPKPDEIDACKGYLRTQIQLVDPEVVITLGNFSSKLLLRTESGITRLRGRSYEWWGGRHLVPTFHPAAALRGSARVMDEMRYDLGLVRALLDDPPTRTEPASAGESAPSDPSRNGDPESEARQLGLFG